MTTDELATDLDGWGRAEPVADNKGHFREYRTWSLEKTPATSDFTTCTLRWVHKDSGARVAVSRSALSAEAAAAFALEKFAAAYGPPPAGEVPT